MPLARSRLCLMLLLGLSFSSCRTINNFFSTKAKQELPDDQHPEPDARCIRKDSGWAWVETDCKHIQTHFIASTIAYLRVMWTLNFKFSDKAHILKKDFAPIYMEASNAIVDAVLHSEGATFKAWYRTMVDMWEHSITTSPENAYRLSYRESYEHIFHDEWVAIDSISAQFGKEFFKFMPVAKANDFPYPNQELIDLLRESEEALAKAFRLWNDEINQDKSLHDSNAAQLGQLMIKIFANKGQR